MSIGFSNPQISVNNVPILFMPNTLKFNAGKGDTKVRAQTAGGNSVIPISTQDKSTQVGKVTFDMAVTTANILLASTWKDNLEQNVITLTQVGISTPMVFNNMSMANDPQFEATADGKFNVMFEGAPAVGL